MGATENSTEKKKKKIPYPKSTFFIVINEFCEGFAYCGTKAILTIYLTSVLLYNEDYATMIYHALGLASNFTPIVMAMIADSVLGRFRAIIYFAILYIAGTSVIAVSAVPNSIPTMTLLTSIGLVILAIGRGGFEPCLAAFGGDQFKAEQEDQLLRFFSLFYLFDNLGTLFGSYFIPYLREDVKCLGADSCFSLGFGVPGFAMIIALSLFLLGHSKYRIVPPAGNILGKVMTCIFHAVDRKVRNRDIKKDHWLDYADDKYDLSLISDVKVVLKVLCIFLPLPLFWALFEQLGSRWTLQATRMDGQLPGFRIKPDQMQALNPILILPLIPLFDYGIYPLLSMSNFLVRPLQKIVVGGLFATMAFLTAGFLEMHLETSLQVIPEAGFTQATFINMAPCQINVKSPTFQSNISAYEVFSTQSMKTNEIENVVFTPIGCVESLKPMAKQLNFSHKSELLGIFLKDENLTLYQVEDKLEKSIVGDANVRIIFSLSYKFLGNENDTFKLVGKETFNLKPAYYSVSDIIGSTDYSEVAPGEYRLHLPINDGNPNKESIEANLIVKTGGNYVVIIDPSHTDSSVLIWRQYAVVEPNSVPMLLQLPQYVLITIAEMLIAITGLDFSYSQAPSSMKSVLQAGWLLTIAFGNLLVIVVAKASFFDKQSHEFFLFACLMGLCTLIFGVMQLFYKYVVHVSPESLNPELQKKVTETTK